MEVFFFKESVYQLHYNCTSYDYESIPFERRHKLGWGLFAIGLSLSLQCIYFPCLYAISRPKLISQSCYKIMLFMGIANVCELFSVGVMAGIYALKGAVFCMYPKLMYFNGLTCQTLYYTEMTTDCLLAFNRMIHFVNPHLGYKLFNGKRTLIWLGLVLIGPFAISTMCPPYIYNSIIDTWVHFPHQVYLEMTPADEKFYYQPWHQIYTCVVCATLLIIYAIFLVQFFINREHLANTKERSIFIQVFWISLLCAFVCVAYAFDKAAVSKFPFLVPIYTYMYLVYQGSPAIIYLLMNETIRRQVKGIITKSQNTSTVRAVSMFPSRI